jgi:hypothetical protein
LVPPALTGWAFTEGNNPKGLLKNSIRRDKFPALWNKFIFIVAGINPATKPGSNGKSLALNV